MNHLEDLGAKKKGNLEWGFVSNVLSKIPEVILELGKIHQGTLSALIERIWKKHFVLWATA